VASVRSEDGSLASPGPFCDVNIIKRPPAYLRAARKRPLLGGPIRARTHDPQEARGFPRRERKLRRGEEELPFVSAAGKAQFYAPGVKPTEGRGSNITVPSSPLSVCSFCGNYQRQRVLHEFSEPQRVATEASSIVPLLCFRNQTCDRFLFP